MNIADEGSTAHLKAIVLPQSRASQISAQQATQAINEVFLRWGLPQCIKIDNGYPFLNPRYYDIPSKSLLWWIGLGIQVIQNTPGCPQENGVVECLQGTCYRWANPNQIETEEQLQIHLDKVSEFQRNHYKMPKRGNMTRIECYPELEFNSRIFDPEQYNIQLVYDYLAQQVWSRKIKLKGSVHFMGQEIFLGAKYANQQTYISFDPIHHYWVFTDRSGKLLRNSFQAVPNEKTIKDFAIMSKN